MVEIEDTPKNREFHIHNHTYHNKPVQIPKSWPIESLFDLAVHVHNDNIVVFAHPEHQPVMLDLRTNEYTTIQLGVDGLTMFDVKTGERI